MKRRLTLSLSLALSLPLALSACAETDPDAAEDSANDDSTGDTGTPDPQWEEIRSETPYNAMASVSAEHQSAAVDGQRDFSLDLFRRLREENDGNFSLSGTSIQTAFGLVFARTEGDERQEMVDNMNFIDGVTEPHAALNWQSQQLRSREMDAIDQEYQQVDAVHLDVINQMWALPNDGVSMDPDFLALLSEHYDAGVYLADFASQPEVERMAINEWVANHTNQLIDELLPEGSIKPDGLTERVIVNAIYLKAPWVTEFGEGATMEEDFFLADGSTKSVPLMHSWSMPASYGQGEGHKALGLPMRGGQLELVAILPDAETDLDTFVDGLTQEALNDILTSMQPDIVDTFIPRFTIENKFNLNQPLKDLGMPSIFEPGGIEISDVFHDTVVAIDESGLEAAAATAIVESESGTGEPPEPMAEFRADRPFMFAIYDRPTRTVLFLGQIVDP